MRLSWCRERAIPPCRPQWTERALRQTWRGRRQSSHWLHRFKRQSRVKWKMPRLISQIRSNCGVLNCLQADCFLWGWFCWEKAAVRLCCLFFPKPWGNFLRIWAWLIRRDVLLQHFTCACFHLVEWITAGCRWDYYYELCKWTNLQLTSAYLFKLDMKRLVLSQAKLMRRCKSFKSYHESEKDPRLSLSVLPRARVWLRARRNSRCNSLCLCAHVVPLGYVNI